MKSQSLAVACVLWLGISSASAQDFDAVKFTSVKAAENVRMLQGAGGNIGLFIGPDGVFLIDDQFAPLHEKLVAQIEELAGDSAADPSRVFLINTHFHHDHTGGNELLGEAGAVIIAHDNVRRRLSVDQTVPFLGSASPALKAGGLPVITFDQDLTFHLNGDSVHVVHVGPAHTDGDAIVHFTKANVIHAGDIVFTESYPFIDRDNGGSVAGELEALKTIISLADDRTSIIPGHGKMTNRASLQQIHTMLATIFDKVNRMVADGKSLEQIQAARLTQEYDGQFNGFISGDSFVGFIYAELTEHR